MLLLLDEPTSGLDSYAAHSVVDNLRTITREKNVSSLMTIHQPSWALLCLYDRVQFLSQGQIYYEGTPKETVEWFDSLGYAVPEGVNPADYYIGLAENPEKNEEGANRIRHLLKSWSERSAIDSSGPGSQDIATNSQDTAIKESEQSKEKCREKRSLEGLTMMQRIVTHWPMPWPSELAVLTHRNWLQLIRDKSILFATGGSTLILLIVIGFAFFRLGKSQNAVLARVGVLFFVS